MLFCAVVDPSAFSPAYLEQQMSQAYCFMESIARCGVLLIDQNGSLLESVKKGIQASNSSLGKRLEILLIDSIMKRKDEKIFRFEIPENPLAAAKELNCKCSPIALEIKKQCGADVLFLVGDVCGVEGGKQDPSCNGLPLHSYIESRFYEQSRVNDRISIEKLGLLAFGQLIQKACRLSNWLRFYDQNIALPTSNKESFYLGIRAIMSEWQKSRFLPHASRRIEIITAQDKRTRRAAVKEVMEEIVEPLSKEFKWRINLIVKANQGNLFHARFLETQQAVLGFDRGVDLFESNRLKTNLISLDNSNRDILQRIRNLPDAVQ